MLAQPRTAAVCVTLRRADRHARGLRDLFERVAERVLQENDLRLLRRDLAERLAELPAELGDAGVARRVVVGLEELAERLVHACPPALDRVEARVDDEPVQPGRELRAAAELLQPDAHLRERLLRGIVSVVRVAQDVACEPFHLGWCRGRSASNACASPSFARATSTGSLSFS